MKTNALKNAIDVKFLMDNSSLHLFWPCSLEDLGHIINHMKFFKGTIFLF